MRRGLNLRAAGLGELENIASDRDPSVQAQMIAHHRMIEGAIERDARAEGLPGVDRPRPRADGTHEPARVGAKLPTDMAL